MSEYYGKSNEATRKFWDFCNNNENQNKIIQTEATEAKTLAQWLRWNKIVFLHIPNERKATARAVAELKRQGLQKGAPDYLVFLKNQVLAIELKRASKSKSRVSTEQKQFLDNLSQFDYMKCFICYGANEAINIIKELKD